MEKTKLKFGIEIEFYARDTDMFCKNETNRLLENWRVSEEYYNDGDGLEIKSKYPCSIKKIMSDLPEALAFIKGFGGVVGDETGLHVHVSGRKPIYNDSTLNQMYMFGKLQSQSGRKLFDQINKFRYDYLNGTETDRPFIYQVNPSGHFEFRLFNSTFSPKRIHRYLQLTRSAYIKATLPKNKK